MQYYAYRCAYCDAPIEQTLFSNGDWLWVLKDTDVWLCDSPNNAHGPACEWCDRDMTDEQCPNSRDICVDCCGED